MGNRVGISVFIPVFLLVAGCCLNRLPADLAIEITSPTDGASVCYGEQIIGTASHDGIAIYVLVHPLNTDAWWIQSPPAPAKRWRTKAYFGLPDKGIGEEFEVRALATRERLEPGQVLAADGFPKDAVLSDGIAVTRTC